MILPSRKGYITQEDHKLIHMSSFILSEGVGVHSMKTVAHLSLYTLDYLASDILDITWPAISWILLFDILGDSTTIFLLNQYKQARTRLDNITQPLVLW